MKIFDEDGNALCINDIIGWYIIEKAKEIECDLDQTTIAVDGDGLIVTGFYYMHDGEQFGKETKIPFNTSQPIIDINNQNK